MKYNYKPQGVCSRNLTFDIEDGIVKNVRFEGGCHGNLQGIARLVEGKEIDEVEALLAGVRCKGNTSCPDQLSKAIAEYKATRQ